MLRGKGDGFQDERAYNACQRGMSHLASGELRKAMAEIELFVDIELSTGRDVASRRLGAKYEKRTPSENDMSMDRALLTKYVTTIRCLLLVLGTAALSSARSAPLEEEDTRLRQLLEALLVFAPEYKSTTCCHLAELCARAGSTNEALQWLEVGLDNGARFSQVKRVVRMLPEVPANFRVSDTFSGRTA